MDLEAWSARLKTLADPTRVRLLALLEIEDPRLPRPTLQNLFDRAERHARELEELRVKCTDALKKQ